VQKELNAMPRRPIVLAPLVAVAASTLLAAGCGGGGGSPQVANIASPTTGTTTTTQSGSGGDKSFGGPAPPAGAHFQIAMKVGTVDGAKFSACMRKHGVTNFPDPNGQGVITFGSGTGIDPNSPAFQSARTTCQKLLPNGGQPTPAQQAQQQKQLLALSACMRAHGIKDFPDPSGGGLQLRGGPGSDLDPSNPTFQKAQQACQKDLPFKPAAGAVKAGGG
jgi:hypothetical protein